MKSNFLPNSLQLLQKESKKLHGDVAELENALILHQRFQDVEENSVRGILRWIFKIKKFKYILQFENLRKCSWLHSFFLQGTILKIVLNCEILIVKGQGHCLSKGEGLWPMVISQCSFRYWHVLLNVHVFNPSWWWVLVYYHV